ncbi:MAG: hypothetical protein C0609_06055 [Deltaproteobacteria bacterium]|nr:MAG: hypothetical protein C0609_06055 [Deltaproteobacteria bacterium]
MGGCGNSKAEGRYAREEGDSQMKKLYDEIASRLSGGEKLSVASIARRIGSAPRSQGTRCAILPGGAILGTIGGGLMEAKTQEAGVKALSEGKVEYLKMRLKEKELAASGMICGGSVDILVAPWGGGEVAVAKGLSALYSSGNHGALLTKWDGDGNSISIGLYFNGEWHSATPLTEELEEAARESLSDGTNVIRAGEDGGLFAEFIERERAPLIVMGAGHVGRALANVASVAGFAVTVVDDREEFANEENLPWAERVLCRPFEGALDEARVDENTFIVIATRGHMGDTICALDALRSDAPYVGMIGSKRKRGMVLKKMSEEGIPEARIASAVRTPVGLSIGAQTPEEIAVSIVAEMIQIRRQND